VHVHVLTLFPEVFGGPLAVGPTRRARELGVLEVSLHRLRDYATDRHGTVDDVPYGGGQGMVLKVDPLVRGIEHVTGAGPMRRVLLAARGTRLTQAWVARAASEPALLLICGRYEGVDERFLRRRVHEEISLGDFVLSGGEIPALAVMDAVIRHLPGSLNNAESALQESFVDGLLDAPCYTRPEVYREEAVPEVLMSGNHKAIERWRLAQRLKLTAERRPDLLEKRGLSPSEILSLAEKDLLDEETRRG